MAQTRPVVSPRNTFFALQLARNCHFESSQVFHLWSLPNGSEVGTRFRYKIFSNPEWPLFRQSSLAVTKVDARQPNTFFSIWTISWAKPTLSQGRKSYQSIYQRPLNLGTSVPIRLCLHSQLSPPSPVQVELPNYCPYATLPVSHSLV